MALRILAKLTELETDPLGFNTTALVSQPERRRLRVGDYRAAYTIDNGEPVAWVVHVDTGPPLTRPDYPLTPRQNIQHPSSTVTTKGSDSTESNPF